MKIGELAKTSGVSASRIRFYEKHGLMPPPQRMQNGYRDYPETMVARLHTITMSKSLGFSLSEIKRFLPDDPADLIHRDDVLANLEDKLQDIEHRIADLEGMRESVTAMTAYFQDPTSPSC